LGIVDFKEGDLSYGVEVTGNYIPSSTVSYRNKTLKDNLSPMLLRSKIVIGDPFSFESKEIDFVPEVTEFCNKIFESIKNMKARHGGIIGLAHMADHLYEAFTVYWTDYLLGHGLDVIGIKFWHNILTITTQWERVNKPHIIHKGTLYYFLAENYLLTGERDLAYIYLYNAIESDRLLKHEYYSPVNAPAYLTALLRNDQNNHMYPLIVSVRNLLQDFINRYNTKFMTKFSITDFDLKFLQNPDLNDIAYFFVYTLLYLFSIRNYSNIELIQNDFSRLKALDIFFNLCLIIDETLKVAYRKAKGKLGNRHSISDGIIWLVESNGWMTKSDLQDFWGKRYLNVNEDDPDVVIPKLLGKSELYGSKLVRKAIFSLLVAYQLRNYGGHKMRQQHVFTRNYHDIIEELFVSLFLSVQAL
jgi:hypothetical protein